MAPGQLYYTGKLHRSLLWFAGSCSYFKALCKSPQQNQSIVFGPEKQLYFIQSSPQSNHHTLHHITSHHITSHHITSHHTTPHHTTPHTTNNTTHTTPHHTTHGKHSMFPNHHTTPHNTTHNTTPHMGNIACFQAKM